ncbi:MULTISPECIES: hypothetical protein [unclassified Pseudoalteromonas]|uniref:hypothetical protein n=1 Tax=unclassified Pseudoalteromonas TaxID=194690 RepID=UPI00209729B2|nr:hypothetical protein [Pseudoalteromonas sp. XMcav2-N]MCO7188170.1 hypothetical protein [Pseudoalteromonas sp. XMcav2-N]
MMKVCRSGKVALISLSYYLMGCSASPNLANDTRYAQFSSQCYQLSQDSFLYTMNYCKGETKECFGIQAFGAQSNRSEQGRHVPNTLEELHANPARWNARIERWSGTAGLRDSEYVASVPKGSRFKIVGLFRDTYGTMGTYWYIQIQFEDTQQNKVVAVPSPYYLLQPYWQTTDGKLSFSSRFVENCTGGN